MASEKRFFAPIDFKTRFPALDGIRALAILAVFAGHYGGGSHGGKILQLINEIRGHGGHGVDLFFVLSGFLITGILYDTRFDSHFFKRFFARRSVRIFPVFYLSIAVLLLLTPVLGLHWHWLQLTFLVYLGNFFGNSNFALYEAVSSNPHIVSISMGHFWSLCVEEQFYFLWPIAVWLIRDRVKLLWTAVGISLFALVLRLSMFAFFIPEVCERWIIRTLPFRMDTLLLGGILALLLRGPNADRIQRNSKWVFLLATAGVIAIFHFRPIYDGMWILTIGLTLTALASAGLIGSTLRTESWAFRVFHLKPLRILGKYSYGFYIYHMFFRGSWIKLLIWVAAKTHSLAIAGTVELSCAFITTFIVAKLSYDLFEVRFLSLKRHFEYDSEIVTSKHAFVAE